MEGSTNSYLKALSYLFKKFLKSYILRRVITSIASDYHDHAKISRQVICQGKSKIILLSRKCFGKNKAEVVWILLKNLSNHFCKSYRNIYLQIFINLCVLCVSVFMFFYALFHQQRAGRFKLSVKNWPCWFYSFIPSQS